MTARVQRREILLGLAGLAGALRIAVVETKSLSYGASCFATQIREFPSRE